MIGPPGISLPAFLMKPGVVRPGGGSGVAPYSANRRHRAGLEAAPDDGSSLSERSVNRRLSTGELRLGGFDHGVAAVTVGSAGSRSYGRIDAPLSPLHDKDDLAAGCPYRGFRSDVHLDLAPIGLFKARTSGMARS